MIFRFVTGVASQTPEQVNPDLVLQIQKLAKQLEVAIIAMSGQLNRLSDRIDGLGKRQDMIIRDVANMQKDQLWLRRECERRNFSRSDSSLLMSPLSLVRRKDEVSVSLP